MLKRCKKCGREKPFDEFYRHPQTRDGRNVTCKACDRLRAKLWREGNPERKAGSDRRWVEENRQRVAERSKTTRERYPEKHRARHAVNNAVRDGKIVKPDTCEDCGSSVRVQGHHLDYAKPLEVEWLCESCHKAQHALQDFADRVPAGWEPPKGFTEVLEHESWYKPKGQANEERTGGKMSNEVLATTDGREWAEVFMRLFGDERDKIGLELMHGWFANAIETGRRAGEKERV